MLFRKTIDPRCVYCRSFVYDPLKRQPPAVAVPDFSKLDESDFEL